MRLQSGAEEGAPARLVDGPLVRGQLLQLSAEQSRRIQSTPRRRSHLGDELAARRSGAKRSPSRLDACSPTRVDVAAVLEVEADHMHDRTPGASRGAHDAPKRRQDPCGPESAERASAAGVGLGVDRDQRRPVPVRFGVAIARAWVPRGRRHARALAAIALHGWDPSEPAVSESGSGGRAGYDSASLGKAPARTSLTKAEAAPITSSATRA